MGGVLEVEPDWWLFVEILYKDECTKKSYRSFLSSSGAAKQEKVECFAQSADLSRNLPDHIHEATLPRIFYDDEVDIPSDDGRPLRYWSVADSDGTAQEGVFLRSNRGPPSSTNDSTSALSANANDYDKKYGDADVVLEALSWLGKDKEQTKKICHKYELARRSSAISDFVLFPFLPIEIRVKIWKHVAQHIRLIEIIHQPPGNLPTPSLLHFFYEVAPRSRQTPPMLLTSIESRTEGLKLYKKTELEFRHNRSTEKLIFFNETFDILLFKKSSCLSTLAQFCRVAFYRQQKFSRVAVSGLKEFTICCDMQFCFDNPYHGQHSPNTVFPQQELFVIDMQTLDILRGINFSDGDRNLIPDPQLPVGHDFGSQIFFPGMPGIKDIFHVLETNLSLVKPKMIDFTTILRKVDSDAGGNPEERSYKQMLENTILDCKNGDSPVWERPAVNPWTGVSLPNFSFVSLDSVMPWENGNTARWSEIWSRQNIEQSGLLIKDVHEVIQDITGCRIDFAARCLARDSSHQERLEICITGPTGFAVEETRVAIQAMADKDVSWYIPFRQYLRQIPKDYWDFQSVFVPAITNSIRTGVHGIIPSRRFPTVHHHPVQEPPVFEPRSSFRNMLEELPRFGPSTIPTRPIGSHWLEFPAAYDALDKHRWWYVADYSGSVYTRFLAGEPIPFGFV